MKRSVNDFDIGCLEAGGHAGLSRRRRANHNHVVGGRKIADGELPRAIGFDRIAQSR